MLVQCMYNGTGEKGNQTFSFCMLSFLSLLVLYPLNCILLYCNLQSKVNQYVWILVFELLVWCGVGKAF